MIKAYDGTPVYLDNNFSSKGKEGISGALNLCWIFLVMCIMAPVFVMVFRKFHEDHFFSLGVPWLILCVMVAFCFGCVLIIRILFFRLRHPMTYHWVQMLGFSFRMYYVGTLLWLSLANVDSWAYMVVIVLWGGAEWMNFYDVRRVSNEEIMQAFKKRFKRHPEGYFLYDPLVNVKDFQGRSRVTWIKFRDRFETLGAGIIAFIGPTLIIRSQLYRENFEPRYLMMAGVVLFVAIFSRSMTTEFDIVRRAMKLKQQGKF